MKATEVTAPGYYWFRDQSPGLSHSWHIVEFALGKFYECGNDVALTDMIGNLYGPIRFEDEDGRFSIESQ